MLLLLLALTGAPDDSVRTRLASLRAAMARGRTDSVAVVLAARRSATPDRMDWLESAEMAGILYEGSTRALLLRAMPDTLRAEDIIDVESAIWLGELAYRGGNGAAAERWYVAAAAGARALGDAHGEAFALTHRVQLAMRQGARDRALGLIDSADAVRDPNDSLAQARVACQRSQLFAFLARHDAADSAARQGTALAIALGERQLAGGCLAGIGTAQAQRGMLFLSDTTLAHAVDLLREAGAPRPLGAALQWRGYVLRELTRLGEADSLLRAALHIAERIRDRPLEGWSRLNLGLTYQTLGDALAAQAELELATAAFRGQLDAWGEHSARLALALAERELGMHEEAEADAFAVLTWAEGAGNAWLQMLAWMQRSAIAEAQGDWKPALRYVDSARVVVRRAGLQDPELAVLYHRARIVTRQGNAAAGAALFRDYLRLLRGFVPARQYAARARLAEALAATGDVSGATRHMLEASDALDAWRDSLDVESLRRAVFSTGIDDPDRDLGVATVIARIAAAGGIATAFELAERRRARLLVDGLVRTAATGRQAGETRGVLAGARLSVDDIRAAVPPDAAAVLFVTGRGGEPTSAFVIARDRIAWRALAPIDSLEADITRLHALLASGAPATPLLARLGSAVVAPWLGDVPPGVRQLVLVPDDVLHHLPFEALQVGGVTVADRYRVALAPSLTTFALLRVRGPRATPGRLLAFADATIPPGDTALHQLPGARREALALAGRVTDADAFVGRDATEDRLRDGAATARVLHLATHAVIDQRSPLGTYIAFAPTGGDDGRLRAAEVAQLPLDAALVVLSACRTAGGRVVAGEGVEGLTAPLIAAGARAVVATRWDVDDRAAAQLMEAFYTELLRGGTAGEALYTATAAARADGAPAAIWAAFALIGDPLVMVGLEEKAPPRRHIAMALGAGVVLLLLWVAARRRSATAPR